MDENAVPVFDDLPKLESSLPICKSLIYIAGYLVHKNPPTEGAFDYFEKFGILQNKSTVGN